MKNVIFLLSKDCMPCESLSIYGNTYWKLPNIEELAKKGTVLKKHYTAAPSTSMAMTAMLSGRYPYEFKSRKLYIAVKPGEHPSIFDYFQVNGYECHLIWDATWMDFAWKFVREFGDENKTIVHNLDIAQPVGSHKKYENSVLTRNDELLKKTFHQIYSELNNIDLAKPQFIWLHLPHVLKGRRSYSDDMDAFDEIVGFARKLVGDDSIYLTTDHGHMNMHKGKVGYGFDVYEPAVHIPMIVPKIEGTASIDYLTCNVDLPILLKGGGVIRRDYIISDTAYYGQPNRKTAIITERFKYIYNKKEQTEELYDLLWDKDENYNILLTGYYDKNRLKKIIYDELYFYPYRDMAMAELEKLRTVKNSFWDSETRIFELYGEVRKKLSGAKKYIKTFIKDKN